MGESSLKRKLTEVETGLVLAFFSLFYSKVSAPLQLQRFAKMA